MDHTNLRLLLGSGRKVMKTGQRRRRRPMHARIFSRQSALSPSPFNFRKAGPHPQPCDTLTMVSLMTVEVQPSVTYWEWSPLPQGQSKQRCTS
ncbi:hypothetical protein EK904_006008 [Melospiza melodia maxima]|nr:hypothetical protein EK904_006008 [Melospiza melodia maxima]